MYLGLLLFIQSAFCVLDGISQKERPFWQTAFASLCWMPPLKSCIIHRTQAWSKDYFYPRMLIRRARLGYIFKDFPMSYTLLTLNVCLFEEKNPYRFFSDLVDLEFHLLFLQLLQMPASSHQPAWEFLHASRLDIPEKQSNQHTIPVTLGFQAPWVCRYLDPKDIPKTPNLRSKFGRLGIKTKKQIDQANSSWKTYHDKSYKMGIGKPVISEGYKIPEIFFTPVTPIYF